MKKIRALCLIGLSIILTVQISAQGVKGSGNLKTDIREFTGFKHLILQGKFEATLVQVEQEGIRINADDNLLELFQARLDNDILYVTMLADVRKYEKLKIYISFKELHSITLLNNIELKTAQVIHFEKLNIFSSGASRIDCEIYTTILNLTLNDNSFTKLKGYAEHLSVTINDETELNSFGLQSENCSVTSSGYSEVMVNCAKTLKLKVTGESNVYYTGNPKITERIFSSAGFIVKRKASTLGN